MLSHNQNIRLYCWLTTSMKPKGKVTLCNSVADRSGDINEGLVQAGRHQSAEFPFGGITHSQPL